MGNSRPHRRHLQKKSLKERTELAEERARQASASILNLRQMYEGVVQEKAAIQQQIARLQALVAALTVQFGNTGVVEVDPDTVKEIASGVWEGFDFHNTDDGGIVIVMSQADYDDEETEEEEGDDE